MTTPFTLDPAGTVEFGSGAVQTLPRALAALQRRRAFVVTDPGVASCGVLDAVLGTLADARIAVAVFAEVEPNPSLDTVAAAAAACREAGPVAVVAVGGGSSLDAAKGIALAAGNPGPVADLEALTTARPVPPVVAVPTTAGTGAETNGFGVFAGDGRKVYLGHPCVVPRFSVLDPDLTIGLPAAVTAATGVDAMVHAVESLTSVGRNPVSEAYAHAAVRLVARWLPRAVTDGGDREARAQLLLGAHLAGRALTISGLGLVHGIAHAVTARAGAAHGVALAAVLARVVAFNSSVAAPQYAEIAVDLGVARSDAGTGRNSAAALDALRDLPEQVGAYRTLGELGIGEEAVPALADAALADPVTRNTPRLPTVSELRALLTSAL